MNRWREKKEKVAEQGREPKFRHGNQKITAAFFSSRDTLKSGPGGQWEGEGKPTLLGN